MTISLRRLTIESWPLRGVFRISRGAKTHAETVVVALSDGRHVGRGECTPYGRYGETTGSVRSAIRAAGRDLPADPGRARAMIARRLPPGAARNALDCALWDLAAKQSGRPAWQLAGLPRPKPAVTCYTLSLDAPEKMADAARQVAELPLLKLKLGADGDAARMRAVRAARPDARLVVDANEGWTATSLEALAAVAHETGVEVVEQPLPADADDHLRKVQLPIPVCADESAAPGVPIAHLRDRYDAVNIKLDKTGGLTAACLAVGEARRLGMGIMVGSMVATSLGMAPAVLLSADARWVDLDSPLLLAHDRPDGLTIRNGILAPPRAPLWG